MGYKVDFHVHSYYSDGIMKPTDIVKMYKEKEYDMIAITDHDGIDGVNEGVIAGEALNLKVIPGIEFSTEHILNGKKIELHLLGYYIDIDNEQLKERLVSIRKDRDIRNEKLLAHLNDLGYQITMDDLMQRPGQKYIGKPNFARALVAKGYALENPWEIFDSVEKSKISTIEAISLIKDAGGMAVLAHPMKIKNLGSAGSEEFYNNLDVLIRELKKNGLKGIECFHPSVDENGSFKLVKFAEKYHLHITEGSDYHGDEKK